MYSQKIKVLWLLLAAIGFLLFSRWIEFSASKTQKNTASSQNYLAQPLPDTASTQGALPDISSNQLPIANQTELQPQESKSYLAHIKTDLFDIYINDAGDIIQAGLVTYPKSLEEKQTPFYLLANNPNQHFVTQTGLISVQGGISPNHTNAKYSVTQNQFVMEDNQNELVVPLKWADPSGITVYKTYTFKRNDFEVGLELTLENKSNTVWQGTEYYQLSQKEPQKTNKMVASSYTGPVYSSTKNPYKKTPFKDISKSLANFTEDSTGGWVSMIQQYFIAAWVPETQQKEIKIYTKSYESNQSYIIGFLDSKETKVEPNQSHQFKSKLYLGPKTQKNLAKVAPKLDLTIDYGWFWYISEILFKIMEFFHSLIKNWGWSIMLVTLTVKIALYWFAAKGYTSMAKMRELTPQMTALREKYGEDRQKLNVELMNLYRQEKINPMSGCWPVLIQIPIFISLYWMLVESVELRQAPWALWIKDLSLMDPYYVLPIIMGITMFIQQKFNPAPADPIQAKVMTYIPVLFTFMFLWFPSGLVLYWIVNNILSITQQWFITRQIEKKSALKLKKS